MLSPSISHPIRSPAIDVAYDACTHTHTRKINDNTHKKSHSHAFQVRLTNDRKYTMVSCPRRSYQKHPHEIPGRTTENCHSYQGLLLCMNCHALSPPRPMSRQSIIRLPAEKWIYSNKLRFFHCNFRFFSPPSLGPYTSLSLSVSYSLCSSSALPRVCAYAHPAMMRILVLVAVYC